MSRVRRPYRMHQQCHRRDRRDRQERRPDVERQILVRHQLRLRRRSPDEVRRSPGVVRLHQQDEDHLDVVRLHQQDEDHQGGLRHPGAPFPG